MPKYLVISHDSDEMQAFWDHIEAESAVAAKALVASVRTYADVIDCVEAGELIDLATGLQNDSEIQSTPEGFAASIGEEYEPETPEHCECGRDWEDCATRDEEEQHGDR